MEGNTVKILKTADGSHTLVNESLDESYHSRHGALQESEHVFIKNGLDHVLKKTKEGESVHIFEMGMGTGLNLILSIRQSLEHPNIQFYYTTLEAYPLPWEIAEPLNYVSMLENESLTKYFKLIHLSQWDELHQLLPNFSLEKHVLKLEDYNPPQNAYSLVFYDAFAPNKQPELWTYQVIERIVSMLTVNGVFVTYSARGQLKRDLKALGLEVESLPGPPGKAEMTRATKSDEQ